MARIDDWRPELAGGDGQPIYAALVDALQRDIDTGVLEPGRRLPPHRELAHRLGLSIGTVTKAYAEAMRRGLITGHVGRGSFVATPSRPAGPANGAGLVDLGLNLPPPGPAKSHWHETMARLRRRSDLAAHLDYPPHAGFEAHRKAAARWLADLGYDARWQDLVICSGTQHGMSLAFAALCAPGDTILTEAGTFHGMKALATQAGYKLVGLAMDREGLQPEALQRALTRPGARPRVLYTLPTLQNPTARVMSPARRAEIVRIARKHDLWMVEDDIYAGLLDKPPTPLAALAPERTFHVTGASKTLAPGLRVGWLVAPEGQLDRVVRVLRATCWTAAGLGPLVATQWIEDGTAAAILGAVRRETRARFELARRHLGRALPRGQVPGLHLWLDLPELEAERVAGRALRGGVAVTPPDAPVVERRLLAGLRLCIGAAPDLATLDRALGVVADALIAEPGERALV